MNKKTLDAIQNFKNSRLANPGTLALDDGTLEGQVPGFPGLITRAAALKETLEFTIPPWGDASTDPLKPDNVKVWLWANDENKPEEPFSQEFVFSVPATGHPVNIARARRGPGIHRIEYEVESLVGNGGLSDFQLLIVDLDAPYEDFVGTIPAPIPPADLPDSVGSDYFQGKPNESAIFTIPPYANQGQAPGDRALFYYANSDEAYLPVVGNPDPFWPIPADRSFPLPLSVVQGHPDGLKSLRYVIVDASGNQSRQSGAFNFDVSLFPNPSNLKAPTIDLAVPGDGLTNRADVAALNGLVARIPQYDNVLRSDDMLSVTLTTSIGSRTLPDFPVSSATFPIPVPVDYATLVALYGATKGLLALTVSYAVKRRSVNYPSVLTAVTDLDLYVVGPDPTGPGLINPDLNRVLVKGRLLLGGEGPDNELRPEHAPRDAIARITLWDKPPTPDAFPFTIRLFYDGLFVPPERLVTNGAANQIIDLDIPWAAIVAGKNGTKLAWYTIGSAGTTNIQQADPTTVDVTANFVQLDAPVVQRTTPVGVINCNSFLPSGTAPVNLLVNIPPSTQFAIGMVVTLDWQGYSDDAATLPVAAAVGTVTKTIQTQSEINQGFTVDLGPYATIFKTIQPTFSTRLAGSAKLHYSIPLAGGPLSSNDATHLVRGHRTGSAGSNGTFCDGAAVPGP
ncbi:MULTISPECIES: hypothetical protein [Pseudomonas fluorescens group]|uniref:Uncharacterized protein n=1 Tax=Pseudomonas petroselini TaxID=2899822 RepID=A0ABS8R3X0_9PSED|nr:MULTISPECIES: hypothetical protein [Pseudomonas fluorescens group]MCD7041938.1 hypothetical protein [Pseudomonas petroselini]MCD7047442.1 hypothetical protein [Pseudomonas petroselini]MCD7070267.1 hypothetical protein [Pseudomonas petroselini]MCD7077826.1 hypothetical protein [Pseudomonas petroselini]